MFLFLIACSCDQESNSNTAISTTTSASILTKKQEEIIDTHLVNGAWKYPIYSKERQQEIDNGLAKDSTIAYLWQQKAMPLFKQRKYELGLTYIDKAVTYDPKSWQAYRAFMKCIFVKNYTSAINDFEDCKEKYGNNYVMDHSYDFYIALSNLQLHKFEAAEQLLEKETARQLTEHGEDWVHYLDLFYLGISKYELEKHEEAIRAFDKTLDLYPNFSEALYYKAICTEKIGNPELAKVLFEKATMNGRLGNTINEDNALYELYPYQVRW